MYSALADYYDTVVLSWSGAAHAARFYINHLPFSSDSPIWVLDIGCGTGLYTLAILERFPRATVWAFDRNEAMVRILERKLREKGLGNRAHVFTASMLGPLPIPSDMKFDCMVASGVLEYGSLPAILHNLLPYMQKDAYFFDAAIQDSLPGRLLAAFWGCRPSSRLEIGHVFRDKGFVPLPFSQLPPSYILLRHLKDAHLFKRAS